MIDSPYPYITKGAEHIQSLHFKFLIIYLIVINQHKIIF